ncbi:hypothetical protein L207DRAFT_633067 [Hyaloscypha variabilis F]|uniref:Uncharacterized protein n=1 Tax=Hyaloscypha variabilis (strain UAMH 11265 / GT02V1 / F) TaxID=1149755 RepID=A0A2J6RT99_HYAVF|nr:hypothetical protein L207DRAFT_633067 [Hyaloscypha variabilis F]
MTNTSTAGSRTTQEPVVHDIITTAIEDSKLGFDDPSNYGISARNQNGEQGLIHIESEALWKDASSSNSLLTNQSFGSDSHLSYEHISYLADQILCNLAIVEHDNHVLIFQNCWEGRLVDFSAPLYLEARTTLGRRYNIEDEEQMPQMIKPDEALTNRRAYFALVDYLTSSVARFMLTADSKELVHATLAVLARWRVKLKAISYSPVIYAEDALIFGEDIIRQSQSGSFRSSLQGLYNGANSKTDLAQLALLDRIQRELMGLSDPTKNISTKSLMTTLRAAAARRTESFQGIDEGEILRYDIGIHLRVHLALILKQVTNGLYSDAVGGVTGLTSRHPFAAVYKVGLEKTPTSFSGDRQENIVSSSDASYLRTSMPEFENLKRNAEKIFESLSKTGPPRTGTTPAPSPSSHRATQFDNMGSFIWQTRNEGDAEALKSITLTKASDVISILVPLALTSPFVGISRSSILHIVSSSEDNGVSKPVDTAHSEYYFQLQTQKASNPSKSHKIWDLDKNDVIPVSSNPLSLDGSSTGDPRMQKKLVDEYRKCDWEKMAHWLLNESTIVVECKGYVLIVLLISAIILLGGIAIGVTVGERIPGVDPWEITNYSWLVVGVVLVFAKSRYVTDWPWHDFLRMRVVCSSVSDLVEVGKVSEQMILIKLLLEENQTTLTTTGPYNGMFTRRAGQGEGFAIDVPVSLSTLFAAGFIVLKVRGEEGDNVVVLDSRRGTDVQMMASRGESGEWLSCVDVGGKVPSGLKEKNLSSRLKSRGKMFRLSRNKIKWSKVLGLFAEESSFG